MPAMPARVLIVEDNPTVRRATADFLETHPAVEVARAVESAEDALEHLNGAGRADLPGTRSVDLHSDGSVDLVLVDTRMPGGMSGIDLVRRLQEDAPGVPCLMYSSHDGSAYVQRALDAGARGYFLKSNPGRLPGAIQQVLAGEQYLDPRINLGC
jgi:DNA-binding NarL/FixJ family response regulator